MYKVGIPRALLFFDYLPFWKTFFEELGARVIVSDITSKDILNDGVKACNDEACLPVKVFHGHVINLREKVDYLFIPRLTSVAQDEYICPKFGGLPDMIRNSIPGLPKIISTEINFRDPHKKLFGAIMEIGGYFSSNTARIMKAYKKSVQSYNNYRQQFRNGIPEWINQGSQRTKLKHEFNHLTIGLLGHPYNLMDFYINMNLIKKLNRNMVNIITPEMLDEDEISQKASTLRKKMFWTFGRRIIGAAMCLLEMGSVQGIIYIMSFGCGIDSFICDMVERRVRAAGLPFSVLVVDEHTGEAGFDTRIEAFVDMIKWRGKNESYISTYG